MPASGAKAVPPLSGSWSTKPGVDGSEEYSYDATLGSAPSGSSLPLGVSRTEATMHPSRLTTARPRNLRLGASWRAVTVAALAAPLVAACTADCPQGTVPLGSLCHRVQPGTDAAVDAGSTSIRSGSGGGADASMTARASGGSSGAAVHDIQGVDGGMSRSAGAPAIDAPTAGAPCREASAMYCLEPGTRRLLRCDGERWATALCDVALDWSCENKAGSIDDVCVFKTPAQCAAVPVGGRMCIGSDVHMCEDAQRSRRVERCGGDMGACTNGSCGCGASVCPKRLATLQSGGIARRLARGASYLFWLDGSSRSLGRVSTDGANQTTIASASGELGDVVADASYVFWTEVDSGRVMRAGLDGGGAVPIATGQARPRWIAMDDAAVYWFNEMGSGSIVKVPKVGGPTTPLGTTGSVSSVLAVGGYVYSGARDQITRVPTGGGAVSNVTTVASSAQDARMLCASSTDLYFSAVHNTNGSSFIGHVPLQGGTVTELVALSGGTSILAVDAQHVYYSSSTVLDLLRCDHDGSNPQPVFNSLNGPLHDIELDESSIYFSAGDAIYKLPKVR
jgi:hypothetical protein